jgi:tetratricopeptide (TPR) repeat protein
MKLVQTKGKVLNPEDDPEYWNSMGYSLALNGKRDKAQKYYEKTLEIDPDLWPHLTTLRTFY